MFVETHQLREKRTALIEANRQTLEAIGKESDTAKLTLLEQQWDTRDREIETLGKQIQREESQLQNEADLLQPRHQRMSGRVMSDQRLDPAADQPGAIWFRDMHSGAAVRAVRHGESIRLAHPSIAKPRAPLGEFVRSCAIGKPTMPELADEVREFTLISTTSGIPIPTPWWGQLIDLARETSMVSQAGAVFVPMDSKTLQIARITGDPTASWKAENSAGSASDPTLETVTLTSKTMFILIKASEEAAMDAPNFGAIIESLLRNAAAAELDRVCLVGSGSGAEPQGIYGGSGVQTFNTQTLYSVAPTNYDFVSRCAQLVRVANHVPNAMFAHPRTYGGLDRLKDSQNQPLQPPLSYQALTHYQSTRIPITLESGASPNSTSIAIVGKFDELLVGVRLAGVLHISRETTDGTDHAFTKYQLHFRFVGRWDVQLARGAAFAVATGIEE